MDPGFKKHFVVKLIFICFMRLCSVIGSEELPTGHMEPLGSHMPPEYTVQVLDDLPSPETFYNEYAKLGIPVIFKGAAKNVPAYLKWSDEELREKHGDWKVEVEMGKKENRSGNMKMMSFKTFLDVYKTSNVYLVADLDKDNPMSEDMAVLRPLLCGGFLEHLTEVVMWFSSGGTKSVLHNDGVDNINCLLDGDKDFVLFDKKYEKEIEGVNFLKSRGYSHVDVDKVDMLEYYTFQNLPWVEAKMQKGDCMFIPYRWYHQVRSYGDRNLAVNVWFAHLLNFKSEECRDRQVPNTAPLSQFEINGSNEIFRTHLTDLFTELLENEIGITVDIFEGVLGDFEDLTNPVLPKIFKKIDLNKNKEVDWHELTVFDVDAVIMEFPHFFSGLLSDAPGQDQDSNDVDNAHEEL